MAQLKFSKRHKIKEDRFVETVFQSRKWATEHARQLSFGITAVIVAAVVGLLWWQTGQSKLARGRDAFGKAMMAIQQGDTAKAMAEFGTTLSRFSKTPFSAMSALMLANLYYDRQSYDQARRYFDRVAQKDVDDDLLKGAALRGLAYCQIQKADYSGAIVYLDKFTKECPKHHFISEVLMALYDCHVKTGNPAAAKQALETIIKDFPKANERQKAKLLLAAL